MLDQENLHLIRRAAHYSHPLGNDYFAKQIESLIGRPVGHCNRGRPRVIKK